MSISVLQNGPQASPTMEPFPHLVIEPALPTSIYEQLAAEYPETLTLAQGGHEHESTCRYFSQLALSEGKLSPLWTSFLQYHTSTAFFREAVRLLEPALMQHYPEKLEFLSRATTVPRHAGYADMELECQFVVNRPCADTVRTIHLDNPRELYALLFYMKPPEDESVGGDLQLYESARGPITLRGVRELAPNHARFVKDVRYGRNKAVLFLNTAASFHGVSRRIDQTVNRRYLNIIAELPKRKRGLIRRKTKPWFRIEAS